MIVVKEGDIVRYPMGWAPLEVRKVYKDNNDELYIYEYTNGYSEYHPGIETTNESGDVITANRWYIYRPGEGYQWDNSACLQMGFMLAKSDELHLLKDYDVTEDIRDIKISSILK